MAEDILQRIVETKREEIRALVPRKNELRDRLRDAPPPLDLARGLRQEGVVTVMAEVKRRSPGAGEILPGLHPGELAHSYQEAGASAISVLTDGPFFGGSLKDLILVREAVKIPVFRKEFIVHPLQLLEARGAGADGTLLIARILSDPELMDLHAQALEVGLTPLVEVHDAQELERALAAGVRLLGINNRNLRTFQTSLTVTAELLPGIPSSVTVVSESGIRTREDVERVGSMGAHAVLVGESLLRARDPGAAVAALLGSGTQEESRTHA